MNVLLIVFELGGRSVSGLEGDGGCGFRFLVIERLHQGDIAVNYDEVTFYHRNPVETIFYCLRSE